MGEQSSRQTSRELGEALADAQKCLRIRSKMIGLAWFRYRIPASAAEDVVQSTFAAYFEVRDRYADVADHGALLIGIFRNKCLEHIDRSVREARRLRRYAETSDAARENPWIRPRGPAESPSVVEQLVRDEDRRAIVEALGKLRPHSRELVALTVDEELARPDLIRRLGLNKNTLDSRLHVCRRELRSLLARTGVSI